MTTVKKNFKASNPNFIARLMIFVLSIFTVIGVRLPESPEVITDKITTTISTSGFVAVAGILLISVFMPIYNLVKTKPKITLSTIIGNPNFWIYFASFALGLLVMIGINIPDGTAAELVGAIYAKDWGALVTLAFANIVDPIVRYFLDRKNAREAALLG